MKQYRDTDYDINEEGKCFSHKSNKFLTPQMSIKYPAYNLTIDGKKKKVPIHRMVAETFIPNPHNLPVVNHKDGDTHNFNVTNLEWVTEKENSQHAVKLGLLPKTDQTPIYYDGDLQNEEWKQIDEYPNYIVSNCGRVMNKRTKRLLKGCISNTGYPEVNLWKNNKGKTLQIHTLVYRAFAEDNDLKGYVINHIDGNKKNNNFDNLEKVTYQENNLHATYVIQTNKSTRPVNQYSLNGEYIKSFRSIAEAKRETKINNIQRAASTGKTAGGYYWHYNDNNRKFNDQ